MGARVMKKKLISLLLLPLIALSQAGDWEMYFDEDFAAALRGMPYVRVAYIETDTNCIFSTGVDSSDDLEVQTKIKPLGFIRAYRQVFGAYRDEQSNTFRLIQGHGNVVWYFHANTVAGGGGTLEFTSILPYNAWSTVMLKRWQYSVNGTTNSITKQTQGNVYNGNMKVASVDMRCRYAYFQMYKGGVLVFDGIPVIAPSGQGALYDRVSKRLIENSLEGSVIYGYVED
jgi:hypothetical protein